MSQGADFFAFGKREPRGEYKPSGGYPLMCERRGFDNREARCWISVVGIFLSVAMLRGRMPCMKGSIDDW
jgi:hypothetical protein